MKYQYLRKVLVFFYLIACCSYSVLAQSGRAAPARSVQKAPFVFIENKGQVVDQHGTSRTDIDFRISASGVNVFIGPGRLHYQWVKPDLSPVQTSLADLKSLLADNRPLSCDMYRMDVTLLGADPDALLTRQGKQNYYERYYLPQCGADGALAYAYEKLTYKNVYPGIDWVLYIKNGQLEYDFVLHPGAKVSDIRLGYGGATSLHIEENGDMTSATPLGRVVEQAPYSFQQDGREIASGFMLQENVLRFNIAEPYEGILTIDPKLVWGTYYGDSCLLDYGTGVASAFKGKDVYFAGHTYSLYNIATTGAHQVKLGGGFADAFLAKFNSKGERLWATYYGGSDGDGQSGTLVTDTLGYVYMAATTFSVDTTLTTPGAYQRMQGGLSDAVLVKFDTSGKRQWATLYGGGGIEGGGFSLATDGDNVYLASSTTSMMDISTTGSHQPALNSGALSGASDAFLVKFNSSGQRLWATYYGGDGNDQCDLYSGLICDKKGYVYMCGKTGSVFAISTPGTHQTVFGGWGDAFLAKFDPSGKRIWGTYLGSTDDEWGQAITCDDSCYIYMTGLASGPGQSNAIATNNAYQSTPAGGADIFLVKFDSSGKRQWGTYYGGAGDESYATVVCNGADKVFLLGSTGSTTGIASPGMFQSALAGQQDMFLAEFDASGSRKWATYYGGPGTDQVGDAVFTKEGYIYLAGLVTSQTGLTTPGSHQPAFSSRFSMPLFAKICVAADGFPTVSISGEDTLCGVTRNTVYSIPEFTEVEGYIWTLPSGWSGASESNSITVTTGSTGGTISVQVIRCGDTSSSWTFEAYVVPAEAPVIAVDSFNLSTAIPYSSYQWLLNGKAIEGAVNATYQVKENGDYTVITVNEWGCTDTSDVYTVNNYGTGIGDLAALANEIDIFPNPAKNRVYIQSPVPVNVVLRTIEGRELETQHQVKYLDIVHLPMGMYTMSILTRDNVLLKTQKLLKTE